METIWTPPLSSRITDKRMEINFKRLPVRISCDFSFVWYSFVFFNTVYLFLEIFSFQCITQSTSIFELFAKDINKITLNPFYYSSKLKRINMRWRKNVRISRELYICILYIPISHISCIVRTLYILFLRIK